MNNLKFDEKLLEKLTDTEIKLSSLQALCLAKDSEILLLESKIDELTGKLREIQLNTSRIHYKFSTGVQTSAQSTASPDELLKLHKENQALLKKIKDLEKNLFQSELKCIELNQMIKSCYNEVELFTEPENEDTNNKHRVVSVIEPEYKSKHRSNSQEDKLPPTPSGSKLSLMNFINYKSKLSENPKTPTMKNSMIPYSFQSSGKKKFQSPVPRYY